MQKLQKVLTLALLCVVSGVTVAKTATVSPQPASAFDMPQVGSVKSDKDFAAILWAADITAIQAGLNVYLQNDIIQQIRDVKSGKTQYFRGTLAQAAYAAGELCKKEETCIQWVYKYSDSTGGDGLGVTGDIHSTPDLCGTKIGLQLGGPHMGLASTVKNMARCPAGNPVQFVWYKDLGLDSKTGESSVNALINSELSGALGITVDLSGDEAKSAGVKILVDTSTLRSSISDHVWVRADYAKDHPDEVHALAGSLLKANEATLAIAKKNGVEWQQLREKGAAILFEAPNDPQFITAIGEMYQYDLTMAGWTGNVQFATCTTVKGGKKELNCLPSLLAEVSQSLKEMGLLDDPSLATKIKPFNHNWESLKTGLTEKFGVEVPRFKQEDVSRFVSNLAASGRLDEGFVNVPVYFAVNQNEFSRGQYEVQFEEGLVQMVKAGGSITTITAYADPSKYLLEKYGTSVLPPNFPASLRKKFEKQFGSGLDPKIWKDTMQAAQNSSQRRANAMLKAIKEYADEKRYNVAFEGVRPQGMGVKSPTNGNCTYKYRGQQLLEPCFPDSSKTAERNRRVVFSSHVTAGEIDISSGVEW